MNEQVWLWLKVYRERLAQNPETARHQEYLSGSEEK